MTRIGNISELQFSANRVYIKTKVVANNRAILVTVSKGKKRLYKFTKPITPYLNMEQILSELEQRSKYKVLQWSLGDIMFERFVNKYDLVGAFHEKERPSIVLHEPLIEFVGTAEEKHEVIRNAHEKLYEHMGARKTVQEILKTMH